MGRQVTYEFADDKESRSHAETYYEIGNVYLQEGALDRAIEEYGRAIELDPNYAEVSTVAAWPMASKARMIRPFRISMKPSSLILKISRL